jgi:hypothetical protein
MYNKLCISQFSIIILGVRKYKFHNHKIYELFIALFVTLFIEAFFT